VIPAEIHANKYRLWRIEQDDVERSFVFQPFPAQGDLSSHNYLHRDPLKLQENRGNFSISHAIPCGSFSEYTSLRPCSAAAAGDSVILVTGTAASNMSPIAIIGIIIIIIIVIIVIIVIIIITIDEMNQPMKMMTRNQQNESTNQ
jgi:hypothetical protein